MMMETVVYSREYLFVKELYDKGELGRIQFLRGSHQQDMAGWPGYWEGLPPMHYATHCVSPCLAIRRQARRERRLPRLGPDRRGSDLPSTAARSPSRRPRSRSGTPTSAAEVTRSLFDTARQYRESFDAYGSKKSFEWQQVEDEEPVHPHQRLPEPEIPRAGPGPRLRPPASPGRSSGSRPRGSTTTTRNSTSRSPRGRPRRLAPAPGPRLAQRDPGRTPRPARRRDLGQLDDGRHLRHQSALKGGEKVVDPDVLIGTSFDSTQEEFPTPRSGPVRRGEAIFFVSNLSNETPNADHLGTVTPRS